LEIFTLKRLPIETDEDRRMPASGMFGNSALLISVNLEIRVEALERVIRCIFVSVLLAALLLAD